MQWARSAANWVADRFRRKPADPGTAEFVPDEDPNMTPYGKISRTSPSYAGDLDYFQGNRAATVGAYGMDMAYGMTPDAMKGRKHLDVHHFDKASMTPEQKQAFWSMKMKAAQDYVKKDIGYLIREYERSPNQLVAKIAKLIGQKLLTYLGKLSATYRKGGQATAGTMNTLTKRGWSTPTTSGLGIGEAYDPQQAAAMFEKVKMEIARKLALPEGGLCASEASSDRDIMKLYYGIRQQIGKFAMGLKIGGMP